MIDNREKDEHVPGDVPHTVLSHSCVSVSQLQDKFELLKRIQHEETIKLEEEKRQLEEEIVHFYKVKAGSETLQTPGYTNIKKDKDRKK